MLTDALSNGELIYFAVYLAIGGMISGILAGLFGIGGGAILVPVFYQVFGLLGIDESVRMHLAVGSSLAIILPTAITSYRAHRLRGAVDRDLLKSYVFAVPAGVVLASLTAAYISGGGLRIVFAVLTLLIGLRLLFNRESWRLGNDIPVNPWRTIIGAAIGFFSTLMGIGGGALNNAFMTVYGRPMLQAVATSSGVGVLIAIPGIFGYTWAGWGNPHLPPLSTGFINWLAVGLIIPLTLIFAPFGVKLAHTLPRRKLELGFAFFMLFVSARFFISLF